ncbi:cytochrome b561 [Variovorax sp. HW608]|uniref:cytochrome b n=1 Tax=Variovorax sp. HW608 TaxID=1034889 RepID=UPI00081FAE3A|nr:cytochrome b [Variovorax sp. HW608]SCK29437.1 cytochrome b561 [Variovorax sp. HW608]
MPTSRSTDRPGAPASSGAGWSAVAKFLHWTIAALILAQFVAGWLAVSWPLSPTQLDLFVWHKSTGMLVLALAVVRLAWRATHRPPPWPSNMPRWERIAARLTHGLLYAVMIVMPLTGWVVSSAAGVPFSIYWLIPLPSLVAPDDRLADIVAGVHLGLGIVLIVLLVLHVAAALRHHYVKRDDVLVRMLPRRKTSR